LKNKILYLPIERASRELDSRLKIKQYFESKGFVVKLYNSVFFHAIFPILRSGYVLENDITYQSNKLLVILRKCGFRIFTQDEEAYGDYSLDLYFKQRFYQENLKLVEHHFFKGKEDLEYFKLNIDNKTSNLFSIANNYRFLRENMTVLNNEHKVKERLTSFKSTFKKVILISSKFSMVNRIDKTFDLDSIISKRIKKFNLDENAKYLSTNHLRYCKKLFESCLNDYFILVSKFPDYLFVIRNHPGEDLTCWNNIFSGFKNVVFDNSFTFIDWAKHSDLIIHNGSTSGLEAFILGRQVIYYNPLIFDDSIINSLQKETSLYVSTIDDLCEKAKLDLLFSEDEYINRLNYLKSSIDFSTDFSHKLYDVISEAADPEFKLFSRISYIFSKVFVYKLLVLMRKNIPIYEY
jgi:surface carbohydrate biosynthesis protein